MYLHPLLVLTFIKPTDSHLETSHKYSRNAMIILKLAHEPRQQHARLGHLDEEKIRPIEGPPQKNKPHLVHSVRFWPRSCSGNIPQI